MNTRQPYVTSWAPHRCHLQCRRHPHTLSGLYMAQMTLPLGSLCLYPERGLFLPARLAPPPGPEAVGWGTQAAHSGAMKVWVLGSPELGTAS